MVRAWVTWWVVGAALWLALVDRIEVAELAAGAAAAAIGATGAVIVRRDRRLGLAPRDVARAAWRMVADLPVLVTALVRRGILRRPGRGRIVEVPAASGPFAEALGSAGPNTVVLDVDRRRRVARAHRLEDRS
jgi:multisubunit Na+/H+ antiporter MnhE subunit